MTFAAALQAQMTRRGYAVDADLAREMEVTSATVSNWKTGLKRPGYNNAVRLEEVLDVQPRGRFLALLGFGSSDDDVDQPDLEDRIWADDSISTEDKRVLVRFLRLAQADQVQQNIAAGKAAIVRADEGLRASEPPANGGPDRRRAS